MCTESRSITFVPNGGLGNRLRSMMSVIKLARDTSSRLIIVWFRDKALNCRYADLFKPIEGVNIVEAGIVDFFTRDCPRKRNVFISKIFQKMWYDKCFYGQQTLGMSATEWKSIIEKHNHIYITSCFAFYPSQNEDYASIFQPISILCKKIAMIYESWGGKRIIGVQIRRTDNIHTIQHSPTSLFVQKMQDEQDAYFYVASDSIDEKKYLQDLFAGRVFVYSGALDRNSKQGIQDAVVEMYLLAKTQKILSSHLSSFGEVAAKIGNISIEEVCK